MMFFTKRFIAILTLLMMLTSYALADTFLFPEKPETQTSADISMTDAIAIAQNELNNHLIAPINIDHYAIKGGCVLLESGQKAWMIMLDELFCGTDALVTISATDASVIHYMQSDSEITMDLVTLWTKEKGETKNWSVEEKALFDWLFFSGQYAMPSEEHIDQDTAIAIALSAVPTDIQVTNVSCSFSPSLYANADPNAYIWLVTVYDNGKEVFLVHVCATEGVVLDTYRIGNDG